MRYLAADLKQGLRALRRRPLVTAATLVTLMLGIGSMTAIYSVAHGVLWQPLPFAEPERLVMIWQTDPERDIDKERTSPGTFVDWREGTRSFTALAAAEPYSFDLGGSGRPERVKAWLVTPEFFDVLATTPLLGRAFTAGGAAAGFADERTAVLSAGLWARRFASDPEAIGRPVLLDGEPYTVVGVMPAELDFPHGGKEIWVPRVFDEELRANRSRTNQRVVARLREGVTSRQAVGDLAAVTRRLADELPETQRGLGVRVVPLAEDLLAEVRPALMSLLAAAACLLAIACVNVASLLLVQGRERSRELAARAALGATRGRLVQQFLVELTVLSVLGGAGGLAVTHGALTVLRGLGGLDLPRLAEVQVDGSVLAFASALSLATVLLLGLVPVIWLSHTDLRSSLNDAGPTVAGGSPAMRRFHHGLLVAEVAFSVMLLVGAGLMVRTFVNLLATDLGFSPRGVAALEMHAWSRTSDGAERTLFFAEILDRLRALPGMRAAGGATAVPILSGSERLTPFRAEGDPAAEGPEQPSTYLMAVTPGYFEALGVPLRSGRRLNSFDRAEGAPVALVNETLARRAWPEGEAVGRRIEVATFGETLMRSVVGVVGDLRHEGIEIPPRPEIYLPHSQYPFGSMTLVVRGDGDAAATLAAAREAIWGLHGDLTFTQAVTLEQVVSDSLSERRLALLLLGSFAGVAILLVGVGLYGTLSYATAHRTREIGIRIALGATKADLLRSLMGREAALIGVGLALGLGLALSATRLLESQLYGVEPADPPTLLAVSGLLAAVALAACLLPARRAAGLDAVTALRR